MLQYCNPTLAVRPIVVMHMAIPGIYEYKERRRQSKITTSNNNTQVHNVLYHLIVCGLTDFRSRLPYTSHIH
jgi:hypothetical protein